MRIMLILICMILNLNLLAGPVIYDKGTFARWGGGTPATYWTDPYESNLLLAVRMQQTQPSNVVADSWGRVGNTGQLGGFYPQWWYKDYGYYFYNAPYMVDTNCIQSFSSPFSNVTVMCWWRTRDTADHNGIVGLDSLDSVYQGVGIARYAGNLRLYVSSGASVDKAWTVVKDQWYHLALSYDGVTYNLYTNGILFNSGSSSQTAVTNNLKLVIGNYYDGNYIDNANYKDVRVYSRPVASNEILTVASGGWQTINVENISTSSLAVAYPFTNDYLQVHSDSTNIFSFNAEPTIANTFTAGQITGTNEFGDVHYSFGFDGVDDRANVSVWCNWGNDGGTIYEGTNNALNISTQDFTISAWFRLNTNNHTTLGEIVGTVLDTASSGAYFLGIEAPLDGTNIVFALQDRGDANATNLYSDAGVTVGKWYHVWVIRDYGGTTKMYVDGVLQAQTVSESFDLRYVAAGGTMEIGGWTYDLNQNMYDVLIYNFANTNYLDVYNNTTPTNYKQRITIQP